MITREEIAKIKEQLQKHFPKAFPADKVPILKKGINKNIYESRLLDEINQTKLNRFLAVYTRSSRYLKAHKAGTNRYDLEGNISGEVTVEEGNYAKAIIASRNDRNKERKEKPQVMIKQERSSTSGQSDKNNVDDFKNIENVSKYTGTLKLNLSTKL